MDERVLLRARIDDLLDALMEVMVERDVERERRLFTEHELANCQESK